MKKHWYQCFKIFSDHTDIIYWHCTQETMSSTIKAYDFVLPLERKPRNITDWNE